MEKCGPESLIFDIKQGTSIDRAKKRYKQSHYRYTDPEASRRLRLPDFKKIGIYPWSSFLLEAESTPGPWCVRKDFVTEKFQ
jgi:hypothetical protein